MPPRFSFLDLVSMESQKSLGLAISLLAALIFGVAARKSEFIWLCCNPIREPGLGCLSKRSLMRASIPAILFLASLASFIISNHTYISSNANELFKSTYLWWASVLLFVLGLFATWGLERSKCGFESSPSFTRWNYAAIFIITLIAGIARFYKLEEIPAEVNMDHVGAIWYSQMAPDPSSWFIPGLGNFNIPAVAFAFLKMAVWFTAPDLFGLRLSEAIFGILMVLASYLLCWRCFDSHKLATLCATLLAVHAGHIHFSRHIANIDPWTFALFAITALTHGVRSNRIWSLGTAGLLFGVSVQLYPSARVIIFTIPIFLLYLLKNRKIALTGLYLGWSVFFIGILVAIGPNFADIFVNYGHWKASNRADESLLSLNFLCANHQAGSSETVVPLIVRQFTAPLYAFQAAMDASGQIRYQKPLFDLIIAPFLWLGLGSSIAAWWRNPAMAFMLILSAISFMLGQVLQINNPYWPRLIFFMFGGCLWIALGVINLSEACVDTIEWLTRKSRSLRRCTLDIISSILLVSVTALVFVVGWRQWAGYVSSVRVIASPHSMVGQWIYRLPENATVCGVQSRYGIFVGNQMIPFFAQSRLTKAFTTTPAAEAASLCGPRPFGWIVPLDQSDLKDRLAAIYPEGTLTTHNSYTGEISFWTFYVP
jgi:hypothetical protein